MARLTTPALVLAFVALTAVRTLAAQDGLDTGGVRFLMAAWSPPREVDVTKAEVLGRRVSLDQTAATLGEALRQITRQADLEMIYSSHVVPLEKPVAVPSGRLTVATALTRLLSGLSIDVSVMTGGALALLPRSADPRSGNPGERADSGVVTGRVTERGSGSALEGAVVTIERLGRSTTSGADGRYRIEGVPVGRYLVRARYIGYAPAGVQIEIRAGEETAADLELERSAQELDQLVVTGTVVPTEVKALPTPVSLIDAEDIALQRPRTVQELFRSAVPGAVGWDYSATPYNTQFSVRGASSLSTTTNSMKVFIDGVEAANAGFAQVDPASIARIEVIRGPQAAAIYGSEAIGGVVQIFTKRGTAEPGQPEVSGEAAAGLVQTPYAGTESAFRQDYKASIRGGESALGYHVGGGYSRLGNWLPNGEVSRQTAPSIYGGASLTRGVVGIDLSARYYVHNTGNNLINPELLESGFVPFSRPSFQPSENRNQTVGLQLKFLPASWWRATLSAGVDDMSFEVVQDRPRLTTPADTLLLVASRKEIKRSLGITTTVEPDLPGGISGALTAGIDYWTRPVEQWLAFNALNTSGNIATADGGATLATRTVTDNSGYFAQAQIGLQDAVFLTAGLRAEENSDFGDSLGVAVLPRFGVAYVLPAGALTLKLRGSWGRAIRAPSPGQKLGFVSATSIQLPNPRLGPERQQGWDAGLDLAFESIGSLNLTYYDQTADNLADVVVLQTSPTPTQQFQNVGRVKNRGVEVEASASHGPWTLRAQYGFARARVDRLSPTYAGDLIVGDQPLLRPKHTAGAALSFAPGARTTLSVGMTYVGSWTYYDEVARFRCRGGTGPCAPGPGLRGYFMEYPDFLKINLNAWRQVSDHVIAFVALDNVTNNESFEASNLTPVRGRSTTVGFRFQH
jgi:outer membrane receptor protein involved in Fe transport